MITSLLLKNKFGNEAVPLNITSTYFKGYGNVLFLIYKGILI